MQNKYEVIGIVGEGAYGIVYKCKNKENNEFVAIKKFKETEDDLVKKTMRRELKMLQLMKNENIVSFQEAFKRKGNLFLVFEFVDRNLLELLEMSPNGLDPTLIRSLIYQLCKAIKYLHDQNIIHRDVKPENLLIDNKMNLKLCDFGFARKININKPHEMLTDYVATRWYRSPELLLTNGEYGPEVDYWAVGCIMGELTDGNPLFPGENETDQLYCIEKVLGNLPQSQINMFYSNPIFNGKSLLNVTKPETLEKRYMGKLNMTAINFMKGLLELEPNKRLNGETVFKHPYFQSLVKRDKEKEREEEEKKFFKMKVAKNGVIVKLNGSSCNNSNSNILANNVYVKKNSSLDKINSHNNKENNYNNFNNINKENNNNLIIYKKINNINNTNNTTINTTNINIINYNTFNNNNNNNINNHNNNNNNKIIKKHIFTKSSLNIFSRPKINNNNFNTNNNKNNNNNNNKFSIFKEYEKINNNNNINNYKEKQITYSLNLTRNSFLLKRQINGNFYTIFNPNKIIESNREKENNLLDEKIKEMKRNKRFKIKKNLFNICNSTNNIFSNSNSQRKKNLKKFTFRNIRNSTNYDSKDNLFLEYLENYPKSLFKSAKIYHTKNNKNEINKNNKIKKRNIFHNNKLKQVLNLSN